MSYKFKNLSDGANNTIERLLNSDVVTSGVTDDVDSDTCVVPSEVKVERITEQIEYDAYAEDGIYAIFGINKVYNEQGTSFRCVSDSEDMLLTDLKCRTDGMIAVFSTDLRMIGLADPNEIDSSIRIRVIGITRPAVNIRLTSNVCSPIIDIATGEFCALVEFDDHNGFYKFVERSGYISRTYTADILSGLCRGVSVSKKQFYFRNNNWNKGGD